MKKVLGIILIVLIVFGGLFIIEKNVNKSEKNENCKLRIVTSFYPMYTIALNLTQGIESVIVENMTDKTVGCIHDYTLTTADMKKIEDCDIFIENGRGLESFVEKAVEANKKLVVIDSSENIVFEEEHGHEMLEEHEEEHEHAENAHVWISIEKYIEQVKNIESELIKANPENETKYMQNANEYIQKLEKLKNAYKTEFGNLEDLNSVKVISLNETYELMSDNLNINITTIETDHDESTLSANKLSEVINEINNENIKYVIVDEKDDLKNAETLKNETGVEILILNSAMSGDNDLNSYIDAMQLNLKTLEKLKFEDVRARMN